MKITKLTLVCAFLIAMSANSVNAQNCSDPNCPFNNVQINGPTDIPYVGGYGYYSLPKVSGAQYNWWNNTTLKLTGYYNSTVEFSVPPITSGTLNVYYWDSGEIKWYVFEYSWLYPQDSIDIIECTVTYNGHTHYFYMTVFIWKYFDDESDEFGKLEELD